MGFKACFRRPLKVATVLLGLVSAMAATAQVSPGGLLFFGDKVVRESFPSTAPVVQVTSNIYTTIALRADGTVVCWGDNSQGRATPPAGLRDVVQISSGLGHTLALRSDGTVVAWGLNNDNQCKVPAGLTGVKSVWAGDNQSYAVKADGTLAYWGNGYAPPAGLNNVKMVAAGEIFAYALRNDGTLVGWGNNGFQQLNAPAAVMNGGVAQIVSNRYHSVALMTDGTVYGWGANFNGEGPAPAGLSGVVKVAAGTSHSIALKADGTFVGWGTNGQGQYSPPLSAIGAIDITANYSYSTALMPDGKVISFGDSTWNQTSTPSFIGSTNFWGNYSCVVGVTPNKKPLYWGRNDFGQQNIPASFDNVKAVAVGYRHGLALKEDGKVVSWANNGDGQGSVPSAASNIVQISAGTYHSGILRGDGFLWLFGWNTSGQCNIPTGLGPIQQVAATAFNTAVLKADGTVAAWGDNFFGANNVPAGLSDVVSLVSGNGTFHALKSDGTVASWGWNAQNFLKPPVGLSGAVQISAGDSHAAVLKSDGTVQLWGYDNQGSINLPQGMGNVSKVIATGNTTVCEMNMYVTVEPWRVKGGGVAVGTVYLAQPAPLGGTTVALSADPLLNVPASVVVPAGSRSVMFYVTASNPTADTQAVVFASLGTLTQKCLLTIEKSLIGVSLNKTKLVSGSANALTSTIVLADPAPAGGAKVKVTTDSPYLTVPATVTLVAGATQKSFTITHVPVSAPVDANVTVEYAGQTSTATLSLTPFSIKTFTLSKSVVFATAPITATVSLNATPASALSVPITSDDVSGIPGVTLVVPAKENVGTATLATYAVPTAHSVTLTATLSNALAASVKIYPGLATLKLNSGTLYGHGAVGGTVTIPSKAPSGGWTIELTGTNCSVPATVTIPAGESSVAFTMVADDVATSTLATVTAWAGGMSLSASKTITPNPMTSFSVNPSTFVGGSETEVIGKVAIVAPVAVDTWVDLMAANDAVTVPSQVLIPAGSSFGTFVVVHRDLPAKKSVKLTVTRLGESKAKTLSVN